MQTIRTAIIHVPHSSIKQPKIPRTAAALNYCTAPSKTLYLGHREGKIPHSGGMEQLHIDIFAILYVGTLYIVYRKRVPRKAGQTESTPDKPYLTVLISDSGILFALYRKAPWNCGVFSVQYETALNRTLPTCSKFMLLSYVPQNV